jgi:PAS domain S-box-containing protein
VADTKDDDASEPTPAYQELADVIEGVDLAVAVVDAADRVLLWNSAAERLTGLQEAHARGMPLVELELGMPQDQLRSALRSVAVHGDAVVLQAAVANRFGEPVRRRLTATPLPGEAGQVRAVVVTLTDAAG